MGNSGLFIITDYSKTILFALLIVLALRNVGDLYTFVWAYVTGTGVLVWMALFMFKTSYSGSLAARLGNLYSWDANDLGVVILVGLGMALLTLQTAGKVGRAVSAVVLIGIGAALSRSGSRGALLGLIAAGAVMLLLLKAVPLWKRAGLVVGVAGALAVFAPPGYWAQMQTMVNPTDDYNWNATDGRKAVALRGVNYMLSHPIFGLGIDNFAKAECFESEKARTHIAGTGLRCTPPHNSFVQAGAELGIPGLILWCVLTLGGIRSMLVLRSRMPIMWERGSPEQRFLYLAPMYLAVAMTGFVVSSTFVTFAWLDPVYYLAALMAGLWSVTLKTLGSGSGVAIGGASNRRKGWRQPGGFGSASLR